MKRNWILRLWDRLLGRRWIMGCDWGYTGDYSAKIIGYRDHRGYLHITDVKVWKEIQP